MTLANVTSLFIAPAQAHQTETAADIGATFHFEPNDIPRAGQPSLAWFALTRRGGEPVSLDACDCTLTLYDLSAEEPEEAIATPTLEPVSAEGYQNIPGAEVNFPSVGAYKLVLQGQPTQAGDFQPFEFQFEVTVAQGVATAANDETVAHSVADSEVAESQAESQAETQAEQQVGAIATSTPSGQELPLSPKAIGLGIGMAIVIVSAILWWRRQHPQHLQ